MNLKSFEYKKYSRIIHYS